MPSIIGTRRCGLLLALALAACDDHDVDDNDRDAATDGAPTDGAIDGAVCACGPTSCGSRVCGRSDCGYLCGTCEPDEFCFVGNGCSPGPGPGTACLDAFGERVWEGDRGFRACLGDPSREQRCTCTGGGPDAWASCDATCADICATDASERITCGVPGCDPDNEVCCIPTGMTDDRACAAGSCAPNHYTRACDGPEDCDPGSICCGGDNLWTATCVPAAGCAPLDQYCHTSADCGPQTPHCCPGPVLDTRTCRSTQGPSCN